MARTSISIDQAVFQEFAAEAKRKERTLFAFANDTISMMAKISAEGGDPDELFRFWRSVSLLKQVDVITLPSDFVDELIAKLYSSDRAGLLKMFSDQGARLVGILKIAAKDLRELAALGKDFTALLPIKQFKVEPRGGDTVEIGIVGAGKRIESTECSLAFLESILNGYGYRITKREVNVGTIMAWASKKFA